MKNLSRLKKYEERVERVIEDPQKLLQIINRIIDLACYELDEPYNLNSYDSVSIRKRKIIPPVLEEQKVAFWEFVKYYGNNQFERAEEHGWDLEKHRKEILWMENSIRQVNGFSSYDLPEGLDIKYK